MYYLGVDLCGWRSGEDLGRVRVRKTNQNALYERKSIFNGRTLINIKSDHKSR